MVADPNTTSTNNQIQTSIFSCFSPNKFLLNSVKINPKTAERKQAYKYMNENAFDRFIEVFSNNFKSIFFAPFVVGQIYVELPKLYGAASGRRKTWIIYLYFLLITIVYTLIIYILYYIFIQENNFWSSISKIEKRQHYSPQSLLADIAIKISLICLILRTGDQVRVKQHPFWGFKGVWL